MNKFNIGDAVEFRLYNNIYYGIIRAIDNQEYGIEIPSQQTVIVEEEQILNKIK